MPPNALEAKDGDAGQGRPRRRPLAELRRESRAQPSPTRERIMEATLVAAGERGCRGLTVAAVLERYGGYRLQFYHHFANLAECYECAHATHARRLERRLLEAGAAAPDWRAGLHAALAELARFARENPALGRGLLVEVQVAGGPAAARRQEVLERLSHALDSARRETGSRHSPPPLTARFMVGAIESAMVKALVAGEPERLTTVLAELERLILSAFF